MSYYYEYTRPKQVKGGIKAKPRRGGLQSWWAERWLKTLEDLDMGARLGRGKTYANRGQVVSLDVRLGGVRAKVQGSGVTPYNVTINIRKIDEQDWKRLAEKCAEPSITADLLMGRMPDYVEKIFDGLGLSLFPSKIGDLDTDCTCPDWANPCKHIAAVYILLGDEFDRNPFLIFRLRGAERDEFLEMVGFKPALAEQRVDETEEETAPIPLPADVAEFWGSVEQHEDRRADSAHIPEMHAALVQQLGRFPFWRGGSDFMPAMINIYKDASRRGADVAVGRQQDAE